MGLPVCKRILYMKYVYTIMCLSEWVVTLMLWYRYWWMRWHRITQRTTRILHTSTGELHGSYHPGETFSGGMDMSQEQTLWCDSEGTSDALSEDNDVLGSPVHNTTGSSSYEPSPPKVKRKSIHEQFSKITMQRIYDSVEIVKKSVAATARKFKTSPGKVRQIVKALERGGTIENSHARIREHMYTKFRNARNVGNRIHN